MSIASLSLSQGAMPGIEPIAAATPTNGKKPRRTVTAKSDRTTSAELR